VGLLCSLLSASITSSCAQQIDDAEVEDVAATVEALTSAACSGSTTYEAENIGHSTGGSTPGGWNLWSNGYLFTNHDFAAGSTSIVVTARGTSLGGVWPRMSVSVGGTSIGTVTVPSSTLAPYRFTFNASAGTREIRVSFDNDDRNATEDRNLLVDRFVVSCEAGSSSFPPNPIAFQKGTPFTMNSGTLNYVYVPNAYDSTHQTPSTLFVWLHGCGGEAQGDIWNVSPGGSAQTWISLAVGGREDACWTVDQDTPKVLAAITEIKKHFNIKPKGVILGGYSSGGDLTYRTAYYNANQFAGVLVANSAPFRDTKVTQSAAIAAAAWRFNIVHLAHLHDATYPIATVRNETNALQNAGFPITRLEVEGTHFDNAGAVVNGQTMAGTNADTAKYLFPYLKAGWSAP
jgi:poly(3-hydroxybutyrate) depolymerase